MAFFQFEKEKIWEKTIEKKNQNWKYSKIENGSSRVSSMWSNMFFFKDEKKNNIAN